MSTIFTFPGQGAQYSGMIADLPEHDAVTDTLATAGDALGEDVRGLDRRDALVDTRAVQIALAVVGVAAARYLIARDAAPAAVMGLSIGAWPAAVVAGVLDFADAISLVAERGRLMGEAYPEGYGMTAVIGLSETAVSALLDQRNAAASATDRLHLANVNTDRQIVVAGAEDDLSRLDEAAREAGAQRVVPLDMAVPSHCALMDTPAAALAEAAARIEFRAPRLAFFSAHRRRRLWRAEDVRDDLVYNMARTVRWADTACIVDEAGFSLAIEMPPGHTLTRLHPAVEPPGEALAVADAGWANVRALVARAGEEG